MKMRNLLFGVILGLFAFVHSTPVDTVTTDNIYHEVMTDGYLIDDYSAKSLTTQLPTRNATTQESYWPSSESEKTDVIEDSHLEDSNSKVFPGHQDEHSVSITSSVSDPQSSTTELPKDTDYSNSDSYATQIPLPDDDQSRESERGEDIDLGDSNYNSMTSAAPQQEKEHYATTTPSVSDAQSTTSTELSKDSDDTSDSDPTQISQSHFTSSSMPNEVMTSISPDSISHFQTTSTESTTFTTALKTSPKMLEESEGSGFGIERETDSTAKMITESNQPQEETSTESSTFTTTLKTSPKMFEESDGSGFGLERETDSTAKMITESNQPQEETSIESSTFTTALKTSPKMLEESDGSGFGLERETDSTAKMITESNQPQEETSIESSTFTTALKTSPKMLEESEGSGVGLERETNKGRNFVLNSYPSGKEKTESNQPQEETSTEGIAQKPALSSEKEKLAAEGKNEPGTAQPTAHAGHSTPGWIIIVGFIVGVAALVMLCVAIATRDKWNKSKHPSQQEAKTNSTNQQRELEMETFLHKDNPTENGKAAEYTVIPLDELPEKYSSH